MHTLPTVIVLAHTLGEEAQTSGAQDAAPCFGMLQTMLHRVLASELPLVLVAPSHVSEQARQLIPGNCIVELPSPANHPSSALVRAITAGVQASSQSEGWLVLPADMPMLMPSTLRLVAQALLTYPISFPQYRARRGHPMGFGRELFSELIRLDHDRDLHRLISRYPSEGVDVNDPGVLLHHHDVKDLRADSPLHQVGEISWFR